MKTTDFSSKEVADFSAVLSLAGEGSDLSAVRVREIAQAADMGKGTLYEYFSSKDEILSGTMLWCMQNEMARLSAIVVQTDAYAKKIERTVAYLAEMLSQRAAAYRILAQTLQAHKNCDSETVAAVHAAKQTLADMLRQTYEAARAEGAVGETVSFDYFSYVLFSALVGLASRLCSEAEAGTATPQAVSRLCSHAVTLMTCGVA